VTASELPDYFEVLQVHRNATPLIITKAYRVLAALYHPDNIETGNAEAFQQLVEAHGVLTDPIRRAVYDRERFGACPDSRVPSGFASDTRAPEVLYRDERELRRVVLFTLYTARRNRPSNPATSLGVLAELFGASVDEMQFTLWYLRGKKFIETQDDGVAITVAGVDHVEAVSGDGDDLLRPLPSHSTVQQAHEAGG
jgi:curved DNA-binding protein